MPAPPLLLSHVHKSIAGQSILRDVSLRCPPGLITALLGPNGAGKTTAVTLAAGLRRADEGAATVFGWPAGSPEARRRLSLVPQEVGFPDTVTVDQLLDFVEGQRAPSRLALSRDALCTALQVGGLRRRSIGGLSGGQRRRLAVVAGMLRVPGLLVLDEATSNLDELSRAAVWELTRDYAGRGGAVLVTSHILADIEAHADRVVALSGGRVVLEKPIGQIQDWLGGSVVSVRVAAEAAENLTARVGASGLADEPERASRGPEQTLSWRTHRPLLLAALIAQAAPWAADFVVAPIPLSDLLARLAGEGDSRRLGSPSQARR
jgi:ABC-2 type transport system ATP-binding protein